MGTKKALEIKKSMRKSISELGNWTWTDPIPVMGNSSNVEREFYRVHRIPICDLEWSDISFIIGQGSALEFLIPLAISYLEDDVFVEVEYYNGDLLLNTLYTKKHRKDYWSSHIKEKQQLIDLYTQQEHVMNDWDDYDTRKKIKKAFKEFVED